MTLLYTHVTHTYIRTEYIQYYIQYEAQRDLIILLFPLRTAPTTGGTVKLIVMIILYRYQGTGHRAEPDVFDFYIFQNVILELSCFPPVTGDM